MSEEYHGFPRKYVSTLCDEWYKAYQNFKNEEERTLKRKLIGKEKEIPKQKAFSCVLKQLAHEKDWGSLKSAMGKMLNERKQAHRQETKAILEGNLAECEVSREDACKQLLREYEQHQAYEQKVAELIAQGLAERREDGEIIFFDEATSEE